MRDSGYWTPPTAPSEGGGYTRMDDPGADDTGGENKKQAERIQRLLNSRSRALRNRIPGKGGYFGPGGMDFLMASNRAPGSPTDFLPPDTGGYGFQLPANAGVVGGSVLGQKPAMIPGPVANSPDQYPVAPVNTIFQGAGKGFLLPQNRPPPPPKK